MNEKKINARVIYAYDSQHETSYMRELEMAVNSVVSIEPAYAAQFFADLRLYGLWEAKAYMLRFLKEKHPGLNNHEAESKFHEVYDRIVKVM